MVEVNEEVVQLVSTHSLNLSECMYNSTIGFDGTCSVQKPSVCPQNGTSLEEIFLLSWVMSQSSLALIFMSCVQFPLETSNRVLFPTIFLNGISLLSVTLWESYLPVVIFALCAVSIVIFGIGRYKPQRRKVVSSQPEVSVSMFQLWQAILDVDVNFKLNNLPFVAEYRGQLLLMTAVSILAVDFPIFPCRFSKTEMFGWSMMDNGVGCFVAIHGMCSAHSRGRHSNRFLESILSSLPLLGIGFLRLALVAAVGYHHSVTEYGIHWNFFFTLGLTKVVCSGLFTLFPFANSGVLSLFVGLLHQCLLSEETVNFIHQEKRGNLFEANKEGICSLLGFVTIYFAAVEVGKLIWKPRCKMKQYMKLWAKLGILGLSSLMFMHLLHNNVQPVSRRLANVPYCIWIICYTTIQMAMYLAGNLLFIIYVKFVINPNESDSQNKSEIIPQTILFKSVNCNGLLYFLLANVLTGLVNITIKTGKASRELSLLVLSFYLCVLSTVVIFTYKRNIQIKFW